MIRTIFALLTGDRESRQDHLDRNDHQAHALAEHPPQPGVECAVDNHLNTMLYDGDGFKAFNAVFGQHPPDAESYRVYPPQPFLDDQHHDDAADTRYGSDLTDTGDGVRPSMQAVYEGADRHLSSSSTYDYGDPNQDIYEHFARDVVADYVWGHDYKSVDMSNGDDLSNVDSTSPNANVWPCENGRFVGDYGFHGITDPVAAAGQLHAAPMDDASAYGPAEIGGHDIGADMSSSAHSDTWGGGDWDDGAGGDWDDGDHGDSN